MMGIFEHFEIWLSGNHLAFIITIGVGVGIFAGLFDWLDDWMMRWNDWYVKR